MKIIALEEEFVTESCLQLLMGGDTDAHKYTLETSSRIIHSDVMQAMMDLGDAHVAAMDAAGINMQVLSFTFPQIKDAQKAIALVMEGNDKSAAAMQKYPGRFSAFAAMPLADPKAAVNEFDRCITKLGFVGGFVMGSINGEFLDGKKYWPVLEYAESRRVPIYLHPYFPLPGLMQSYLKGREELSGPEWGFMIDASCHFMRLVTAGVFDQFPRLKIILGHLGESIPYNLERINNRLAAYARAKKFKKAPIDYFRDNLVVTTSGNFSVPSLACAIGTIGVDNILFSVDWPNESNKVAVDFLTHLPVAGADLEKIAYKNAERVLGIKLQ